MITAVSLPLCVASWTAKASSTDVRQIHLWVNLGEGLVIVAAMVGLGLALMYLFLVWMPNFKFSL